MTRRPPDDPSAQAGRVEDAASNGAPRLSRSGPSRRSSRLVWLLGSLALRHPWWYAAGWAALLAAVNLVLRVVLIRMPLGRAAPLAMLTGVGFFVIVGPMVRWRVRSLRHARAGSTTDSSGRDNRAWRTRP